ncbi:porin [Fulvivirga ligni]|uniref:porin n=1 Tax=Fulvivirga ligni TaxID=2904246 RepID=UPI001F278DDA|nr:porin [Fulvivirga ligni]UII21378.1 OprO/OprP family phosphate-selective porin [Fulvivirga ligni]
MKRVLLILILGCASGLVQAQVTFGTGDHVIEIKGRLSTYYNQRFLKDGEEDQKKDRFKLRDAQIDLEGRIKDIWEYEIQVDFADLAAGGEIDPANPGLMDTYVTYKGLSFVNVKVGYGKLPYSRSSMTPFPYSPYWQRSQIARGDLFSRRDVGVTLYKDIWQSRINVYAGAYTGLGEYSLKGDNDASGNLEYVGRVDFSYPAGSKKREVDYVHTPVPLFSVGINGRYANKSLPEGEDFPENSQGEYGMSVIDGKKYVYGFDVSLMYQGFSGQFEMHQVKGEPQDPANPLLLGLSSDKTDGYFLAGGYYGQLSYFAKCLKTILSVRYEQLNLNDLAEGDSKRLSAALAYQLKGFDAMFKAQYFNVLSEEEAIDALKWKEQIRVGLVLNL